MKKSIEVAFRTLRAHVFPSLPFDNHAMHKRYTSIYVVAVRR